ncbi:hypothetical protein ACGFNU_40845 [Spirillospora sp. NPDC048911]|uniref:hypothetical protein n=1 Tax=Spirillospora sp. NPDC048911 TaxID=3364527 RepID=UPI00370FA1B6
MTCSLNQALGWAEEILRQLSPPGDYRLFAEEHTETAGEATSSAGAYSSNLTITWDEMEPQSTPVQSGGEFVIWLEMDGGSVGAVFQEDEAEAEVIARLADQFQDYVLEVSGSPAPPCPEHQHPLSAVVVAGKALWTCPKVENHFSRPIISAAATH